MPLRVTWVLIDQSMQALPQRYRYWPKPQRMTWPSENITWVSSDLDQTLYYLIQQVTHYIAVTWVSIEPGQHPCDPEVNQFDLHQATLTDAA